MKPIGKGYFAVNINANEQFNYFKVLVKWLFQINEIQTGDYTKYDDPLTVASNIRKILNFFIFPCFFLKNLIISIKYMPLFLQKAT